MYDFLRNLFMPIVFGIVCLSNVSAETPPAVEYLGTVPELYPGAPGGQSFEIIEENWLVMSGWGPNHPGGVTNPGMINLVDGTIGEIDLDHYFHDDDREHWIRGLVPTPGRHDVVMIGSSRFPVQYWWLRVTPDSHEMFYSRDRVEPVFVRETHRMQDREYIDYDLPIDYVLRMQREWIDAYNAWTMSALVVSPDGTVVTDLVELVEIIRFGSDPTFASTSPGAGWIAIEAAGIHLFRFNPGESAAIDTDFQAK